MPTEQEMKAGNSKTAAIPTNYGALGTLVTVFFFFGVLLLQGTAYLFLFVNIILASISFRILS